MACSTSMHVQLLHQTVHRWCKGTPGNMFEGLLQCCLWQHKAQDMQSSPTHTATTNKGGDAASEWVILPCF